MKDVPQRMSPGKEIEVRKHVNLMLQNGIINESNLPMVCSGSHGLEVIWILAFLHQLSTPQQCHQEGHLPTALDR